MEKAFSSAMYLLLMFVSLGVISDGAIIARFIEKFLQLQAPIYI
jgi:hypothetical protein